ncbi:PQQ-like beta-propeller repeat protein [Sphingomicrobium sediminis]|uniref:PQQ-like beta-propeller repeat protein n=1 Tax=Sphingomicrobium sediminis TaxID=2950949 RepID=A0A9X2J3R6_9SPHN|nr:PQQ-like beta-propeller repeat protein [Sphingomicrobium sediminis]MCM8557591.1 PQQ-like beta-propeller repeat protein [Sphingomicrobium sediminis]
MMMRPFIRLSGFAVAAAMLSGCGLISLGDKNDTTPVIGERQPVLGAELDIGIDAATAALPANIPAARVNNEWSQSGGNAAKSMGHLAIADNVGLAWSQSIGQGSSSTARLASEPIVTQGRVYTMDTLGVVRAFDAQTGTLSWSTETNSSDENRDSLYGGGVAFGNGRIYATNGLGNVVSIDPANGGIFWTVTPAGPLRGAPTVDGTHVYVTTQDNQIFALSPVNGSTQWSNPASFEMAGVFGSAAPAAGRGTVVAGFSSGELNGYRYENGRLVWQDVLTRTSISRSVSSLSDIDADPVIDGGQVFALGQGGRMVALDILSGRRQWELNIAGSSTPYVAGNWVYVVTSEAQLIAIARQTGLIRWINQLPRFRNEEKRRGPIFYAGPVMAGNRLFVTGSNGALVEINADTGAFMNQRDVGQPVSLQPVVANQTLYVLTDEGRLAAYR